MKYVVDSSVIVKWLNTKNEENVDTAYQILLDAKDNKVDLIAPEIAKYEVGNVLLKRKQLIPAEAHISLEAFYNLPVTFFAESKELANETFKIAHECTLTYYDAAFLALAKQYNATLITDNIKHQGKALLIKTVALKKYQDIAI